MKPLFSYCCAGDSLQCCKDPNQSVYNDKSSTYTGEAKFRKMMFQIMIVVYLCIVFGQVIHKMEEHNVLLGLIEASQNHSKDLLSSIISVIENFKKIVTQNTKIEPLEQVA